ncbi:MAG: M28 family peptidase [Halobacteria archaeon]|nr:M28 family peptidase [Halobacteria archaeon]
MSRTVANPESLTELEKRVVEEINDEEPWALLEEFSELERVSGTDDEKRAAEYICDRLEAHGVSYDRYDPELYISQPHDAKVRTLNRDFDFGPVKTVSFSASTAVSGDVEYVGSVESDITGGQGFVKPYEDVGDLDGKIALTDAGSLSIRATTVLEEKGAAGVIAVHEHEREPHNGIATPVWGGAPPLEDKERIPDVPVVNIRKPDGEQLREWAQSNEGLSVKLETDLTTDWMECPVVVARIDGKKEPENDDFVLLHGHYDSWYVGITDNATGNAGLLECARVFNEHRDELKRDLWVAWWPGHSTGRYAGSTWFVDEFAHDLVEGCVAQVNMDSPGAKGATEYTDMTCWMPEANAVVAGAIDDVTGAPRRENRPPRAGDYSFNNLGITGFFMLSSNIPKEIRDERGWHQVGGCGGNADAWHLTTDTLDKAGLDELVRDIRVYAVSVLRVLNSDVLPLDHRHNLERHIEVVEEYDETAGEAFDLGETLSELEDLHDRLTDFYDRVERGEVDNERANETIKRLSRILTRLNFTSEGQYRQDPAVNRPPYPRLAPVERFDEFDRSTDDYRFLQLQLKREQNYIVSELREAKKAVRR